MADKLKRERRCIWKAWGNYSDQTARFNLEMKLYEIKQDNRVITLDCNEVDSLIITLLKIRKKAKSTRKNHGK